MKVDKRSLIVIGVITLIAILFIVMANKSGFNNINALVNDNYSEDNCYSNSRVYPSGKTPGSYLGLSRQEIDNLLPQFILNKN
jgi:nitrate/TMAO reductase-like tetraheme cytochrome c subunit